MRENPFHDREDAADARHNTPPKGGAVARVRKWANGGGLVNGYVIRQDVRELLAELDRLRGIVENREEMPRPGLTYVDPNGRFECTPAQPAWLAHATANPESFSPLELAVMEAHVRTALANVRRALHAAQWKKKAGGQL